MTPTNKPLDKSREDWLERIAKFTDDYLDEWTAEGNDIEGLHRIQDELIDEILSAIAVERQQLIDSFIELIGEDEKPQWDDYYGFCNWCDFQPTDDTKNCLCIHRNKLRKQLKASLVKMKGEQSIKATLTKYTGGK